MDKFNVIIPAAGAATRLRPLSSNTSKIMVRVNGKPCLDYIVESLGANANQIVIVDGQFNDIRDYCSVKHPLIDFVKQPELLGPRDAISHGINELKDDSLPVVVWLGDAIILEKNLPLGKDFLLTKTVEDQTPWCMWDGNDFYNKPTSPVDNATALVGLYSMNNGKCAKLAFNNTNGYDISDALIEYLKHDTSASFNNINTNEWYDIGDLSTYYKTCASLLNLKARAFNNLCYDSDLGTISKKPDYHDDHSVETLMAERVWYNSLTPEQSMFTPRILPSETNLIMSYESGTLLSDLMLYDNISDSSWDYILDKVFRIKLKYFNNNCEEKEFLQDFSRLSKNMWVEKAEERFRRIALEAKYKEKLRSISKSVWRITKPISGMHGDLHFANILYNQQTDQIKVIDPRGNYSGHMGTNGDDIYDWAKLAHDLYHGYNSIVSNVAHNQYVKQLFVKKLEEYKLPVKEILDGGLLLLATCVPLHGDDPSRQNRMLKYVEQELKEKIIND